MAVLASQGLLAAYALDCADMIRDDPILVMATAGVSSVFGVPWYLAIATGSNGGLNQIPGMNNFALQQLRERRPTLDITGPPSGIAGYHEKLAAAAPALVPNARHYRAAARPHQQP